MVRLEILQLLQLITVVAPKEMMTAKRSYCLTPVPEGHKPTAMYFAQMAELITIGLILFILLCFS